LRIAPYELKPRFVVGAATTAGTVFYLIGCTVTPLSISREVSINGLGIRVLGGSAPPLYFNQGSIACSG
jgi:hypothetical protein